MESNLEDKIDALIIPKGIFSGAQGREAWSIKNRLWHGNPTDYFSAVIKLIQEAPLEECLTSPSEFIREYRRWYENKQKDNLLDRWSV